MPKQFIKLIAVVILLSTSLYAQVDSTKADKGVNINFFNGYAISYKWNASQDMSYRVYLDLSSSWINDNYESKNHYYDGTPDNSETTRNKFYMKLDLSFQSFFNLIRKKSFNFYLGIGPNLSYAIQYMEGTAKSEDEDDGYWGKSTDISYGIGIISLVGIEAYLSNTISLFAETHFSLERNWSNYKYNSNYKEESSVTHTKWNANLQLVKVGLGIYF